MYSYNEGLEALRCLLVWILRAKTIPTFTHVHLANIYWNLLFALWQYGNFFQIKE